MVKFALILPALLPLLTFVTAKHKHVEVHVRASSEINCKNPILGEHERHELEDNQGCEKSWHYAFKSFEVEYDHERPWNPRNLDCYIDLYSDHHCVAKVGRQHLDGINGVCTAVNADTNSSAMAAKLDCRAGKDTPLITIIEEFPSIATQLVGPSGTNTPDPFVSPVSKSVETSKIVPKTVETTRVVPEHVETFITTISAAETYPVVPEPTPTTVCKPATSTFESCYSPSVTTSVATITFKNWKDYPIVSTTTSTTTWTVPVLVATATTSSSIYTVW